MPLLFLYASNEEISHFSIKSLIKIRILTSICKTRCKKCCVTTKTHCSFVLSWYTIFVI